MKTLPQKDQAQNQMLVFGDVHIARSVSTTANKVFSCPESCKALTLFFPFDSTLAISLEVAVFFWLTPVP